ncbi:tRNA (guanosine(46)-N7)-methyltransferase TrmB [Geosporobacter ferrireducens]|uniref:tRNA (guanine-N(7)-)-methyltransferase n=1 Tax=Geosporobacter ferrireducens TaxID=1424294 RepID=A0A1D8GJD5_9FIRM|nr:tRNA (guanosine(46)-N7)-methyltransferase TrmB [Geosporobacter ferrireducens]AOT71017.1 tRNA (guanosine(46)-N7)-methyltransferase TrmB [Geosporobacter ferrireducens]MTI58238.1 tRNA (guanosine(46)-N7)-methyltransferase TrmB [Geosporobacter ferrireducens]
MRRRKKPGSEEKLLSKDKLVVAEPERYKGTWHTYFQQKGEIHVEIGTGRGQFLTTMAERNPHINYVGIEMKEEVLLQAVIKAEEKKLQNIAFLWLDANRLTEIFEDSELQRMFINFCDPWPKNRWAKRRLTYRGFLEIYKNLLAASGEIHFKTDNAKLFEFSLNEFSHCDFQLKKITFDLHQSDLQENITTEYEDKFVQMGKPIYRCEARKRN